MLLTSKYCKLVLVTPVVSKLSYTVAGILFWNLYTYIDYRTPSHALLCVTKAPHFSLEISGQYYPVQINCQIDHTEHKHPEFLFQQPCNTSSRCNKFLMQCNNYDVTGAKTIAKNILPKTTPHTFLSWWLSSLCQLYQTASTTFYSGAVVPLSSCCLGGCCSEPFPPAGIHCPGISFLGKVANRVHLWMIQVSLPPWFLWWLSRSLLTLWPVSLVLWSASFQAWLGVYTIRASGPANSQTGQCKPIDIQNACKLMVLQLQLQTHSLLNARPLCMQKLRSAVRNPS